MPLKLRNYNGYWGADSSEAKRQKREAKKLQLPHMAWCLTNYTQREYYFLRSKLVNISERGTIT
jgi:hypothetical protein